MEIGGCLIKIFVQRVAPCHFRKSFVNLGKLILMFSKKIGSSYKLHRIIVLKVKCILINI